MLKPFNTDKLRERQSRITSLQYNYQSQSKREIVDCNLCGNTIFTVITHQDRYGFSASASMCNNCGLVFLNPVMTQTAYKNFYDKTYRPLVSAYHGRKIDAETIQDEQKLYANFLSDFIEPFIKQKNLKTLLDIGGSTGVVANYLKEKFGFEVTILDPSPLEIQKAQQMGIETITGLIENFQNTDRRFDLILLCQTIDHLLDIKATFHKVHQMLSFSGLFFLDIVDFQAVYLRNRSVEEAIKIDHPYYLTEVTMEAYLKLTGFEILRKTYARDHIHIGYLCQPSNSKENNLKNSLSVSKLLQEIRKIQNLPDQLFI